MDDYNLTLEFLNFSFFENNKIVTENKIPYETAVFYSNLINSSIICTFFTLFGVLSNAVNMAVFLKMGFKDSINMSLFALAISDFGSCLFMIPVVIGIFPWITELDLPINWNHFAHCIGAWPHVACTKITTLITAFITFERCLCVSMPLKVKTIITRKRTMCFLAFSYFIVLGPMAPLFYSNQFQWRFDLDLNKSILGLVVPKEREDIEKVVLPFINVISVFAFIFIIISTIVLVVTLQRQSKWRQGAATITKNDKITDKDGESKSNSSSKGITTKEQAISKMVVMISSLFIASLFPSVVILLLLWSDRRFDLGGSLFNLFAILVMITNTLETVNAALNIVIYYRNSSNYKAMFDQTFRPKTMDNS